MKTVKFWEAMKAHQEGKTIRPLPINSDRPMSEAESDLYSWICPGKKFLSFVENYGLEENDWQIKEEPISFECEWIDNDGSQVIHPIGAGVRKTLQPFLNKKTKVTIEVLND